MNWLWTWEWFPVNIVVIGLAVMFLLVSIWFIIAVIKNIIDELFG